MDSSTSGGCVMHGSHCIRTWSSTQPSVTLYSGEAEFHGLVKASGAELSHQSLVRDLGLCPLVSYVYHRIGRRVSNLL